MPRQSAAVYRRRRLAVLLLLVLVAAVLAGGVWLAVAQPWSAGAPSSAATKSANAAGGAAAADATADAQPHAEKSADPSAEPEPSPTPGIAACTASDVTVVATTDADTYPAGELPKLSITLTNTGTEDCTMNVGSSTQKFTVTSGSDVWWRSTDCQSEPSDFIATLEAGKTVTSADPVVWDRTRSSVDTCEEKNRPRAPGGGASYRVSVEIGGFQSDQPKQILLR
ncbi:hypothetical protein [Microbacterium sp. USHLN186]|uniref:hypothetical protein n=1 Tax=Microbacterium sp. USHLN186 TaxID=3081286 RepID=UPI003017F856